MEYHFHPPYFRSDPFPSFADAWEIFCCQLLNLEKNTHEIRRWGAPEQGIDLIWDTRGLAYQCKSVEHELGKFRLDKALESLKAALKYQAEYGWKTYGICTNVIVTGSTERTLKREYPDLKIYDHSYWLGLCRQFHDQIADYFGVLLPVLPAHVTNEVKNIQQRFSRDILPLFSSHELLIHVFVAVHAYQYVFDLQVPPSMLAQEFLLLIKNLFRLPDPMTVSESGKVAYVTHYLCLGEREIPLTQRLGDLQIEDRPVFTVLRLAASPSTPGREVARFYEGAVKRRKIPAIPQQDPFMDLALERYKQQIDIILDEAAKRMC